MAVWAVLSMDINHDMLGLARRSKSFAAVDQSTVAFLQTKEEAEQGLFLRLLTMFGAYLHPSDWLQ